MKTLQRNTKYYNNKTTDTTLACLLLAETVGYEGNCALAQLTAAAAVFDQLKLIAVHTSVSHIYI